MGRADDIRARMAAEIELAEAEDALIAAKGKRTSPEALRTIKNDLRSLRQTYRENNAGGGTANPDTVRATASTKKAGGN